MTKQLQGLSVRRMYRKYTIFYNHMCNQTFVSQMGFLVTSFDGKRIDDAKAAIDSLLDGPLDKPLEK